jgi:heterodisulfide reductase subunit A
VTSVSKPTKRKKTKQKRRTSRPKSGKQSTTNRALFICHCGSNIESVIDIDQLKQHYETQPNLIVADDAHFCVEQGLNLIRDTIQDNNVGYVVVAACSPHLHGELLSQTVEEAGLNRGHLAIANIREQCSWVHYADPEAATTKARLMIDAALKIAEHSLPLHSIDIPITKRVLVIGGGIAGITASLQLANAGYEVILVEKTGFLGGHMAKWDKLFPSLDCSLCILGPIMTQVDTHPKIRILTLSEVTDVQGTPGVYEVQIHQEPRYVDLETCNGCNKCLEICPIEEPNEYNYGLGSRRAIVRPFPNSVPLAPYIDMDACVGCQSCVGVCEKESILFEDTDRDYTFKIGAIVVATGFQPFNPQSLAEYGYERFTDVITAPELERLLNPTGPTNGIVVTPSTGERPNKIAFVQCVGSRDIRIGRPYCSRICCTYAVKEAVQLRLAQPDTDVYVFYTDMRTFGKGFEELYERAAREHGITFIRGRVGEIEEDPQSKKLLIRAEDTELCDPIELPVDMVVLSVGVDPSPTNAALATILNIPLDENNFFLEKHPKLDPTGTYSTGIYLAGTSQGPKDIADTVAHAGLAAAQVSALLHRRKLSLKVTAPLVVDADLCEGCRLCEKTCDANAISFENSSVPEIDEIACTGCGACVAACPTGALDLPGYTRQQLMAAVSAACTENPLQPVIIGFLCNWCAYTAADRAGVSRLRYPPQLIPIRVPCSSRLDPLLILEAFSQGADGVAVLGCHETDCHYRTGVKKAKTRIDNLLPLLGEMGISADRLFFGSTGASEGGHLQKLISDFVKYIAELGPLGSELAVMTKTR